MHKSDVQGEQLAARLAWPVPLMAAGRCVSVHTYNRGERDHLLK